MVDNKPSGGNKPGLGAMFEMNQPQVKTDSADNKAAPKRLAANPFEQNI